MSNIYIFINWTSGDEKIDNSRNVIKKYLNGYHMISTIIDKIYMINEKEFFFLIFFMSI